MADQVLDLTDHNGMAQLAAVESQKLQNLVKALASDDAEARDRAMDVLRVEVPRMLSLILLELSSLQLRIAQNRASETVRGIPLIRG